MARARGLANEVRTGLEDAVVTLPSETKKEVIDVLDSQWMGKSVKVHVREFAVLFAIIFTSIASYQTYHYGVTVSSLAWALAGIVIGILGYRAPRVLHPLWKGWMKLAHYLSIVMTFVIMSLTWTIGFVPMAMILKVLRIKTIDLSYKSNAVTYWETRDPKFDDFKRLEQQF
ncbi:MAG: Saxitoxin biosynthesis operon protein SxtJ [Pseudomonadota bacterium]